MKLSKNVDQLIAMGLLVLLAGSVYTVFTSGTVDWDLAATIIYVYMFIAPLIIMTIWFVLGRKKSRQTKIPIMP